MKYLSNTPKCFTENVETSGEWLEWAQNAYKNTYAFEFHGDSLLIAREAMLVSFNENFGTTANLVET